MLFDDFAIRCGGVLKCKSGDSSRFGFNYPDVHKLGILHDSSPNEFVARWEQAKEKP